MNDLRDSIRTLRAAPGFTAVALVVLALGIGATTALFSVVDAVVLRNLPFDEPDRLVAVGERRTPGPLDQRSADPDALMSIATPNYLDWAAQQQVFASMAAVVGPPFASFTLTDSAAEPEDIPGLRVTSGFFDVLRIRPMLGRIFTSEHDIDGRHRVVVLSDSLCRRRFARNPDIVGRRRLRSTTVAMRCWGSCRRTPAWTWRIPEGRRGRPRSSSPMSSPTVSGLEHPGVAP